MAQLRHRKNDFLQAGAGVVLVGMGTVAESAEFARKQALPFPLIADPEGRLYGSFGLQQASFAGLFSPKLMVKAATALTQGFGMGKPVGDIRQLPGVFIIDTEGNIVFRHISADPADHPDAATLLQKLRELA